MVDIIAALRAGAAANAGIAAQVGTRVFALKLPLPEAASMPRRALVFGLAGREPKNNYSGVSGLNVDAVCYGASFSEADAVRRAVSDFLGKIGNPSPLFSSGAKISAASQNGSLGQFEDPEKQWPTVFEGWLVTAHEEVAA